jgi:hypothetical protein
MIGKPYSGKPNVRFDEGELEIEPLATTPALYSTLFFVLLFPASSNLLISLKMSAPQNPLSLKF